MHDSLKSFNRRIAENEMGETPLVSIVIPCRNEERFIGMCLDSILASDYCKDKLEVLVVDGMSNDRTRSLVQKYAEDHSFIHLYVNPHPNASARQNIGINHANGDAIIMMIAHATYAPDYISKCVEHMSRYDVDSVGGAWLIVPRDNTFVGNAIAQALSHSFGAGNSSYRTRSIGQPVFKDAAAFGCYNRAVFERFGLFDEDLDRSYDFDFNLRLRRAGSRMLLAPDAVVYYYARSRFWENARHHFANGLWVTYPLRYGKRLFSIRHLIPMVFVLGLLASMVLSPLWSTASWMLMAIIGAYMMAALVASVQIAVRTRDLRYLLVMPAIFASVHLAYGLGGSWGLAKVLAHSIGITHVRS